ncbi:MAG TPA: hypothetical protein VJ927_01095 [Actinomycetota bacterium]|nr:hypothetical protein [Actinomycetota bacterium]
MTRRIAVVVLGVFMALGVAPAAQAEDGPCGQAPGPHCRPMDCEIVWTEAPAQSPDLPTLMVPEYKCYM